LFVRKILSIRFTNIVCINLDRRPERWQRIQDEFARHSIPSVRRFSAYDGNDLELPSGWSHSAGAYGCLLSHIEVVKQARDSGASSVLIFEDDAVLDPDFQNKLAVFSNELPDDWDMLYFGALHKNEPVNVSEHVGRVTKANSTFAYALKRSIFDAFIELNSRAEHVLDMNTYLLQERFNCYCFMPNLAWVEVEYSDVQNRLERHWYLEQSLVLFGAEMDRILGHTTIVVAHNGAPDAKNVTFLEHYYEEYFSPLVEIVLEPDFESGMARSDPQRTFLMLAENDIYLEALDIRANLRMCEQYDAATGFDHVVDLDREQAALLRRTGITRGIDVTCKPVSKNTRIHFYKRGVATNRVFNSPNHALRLPRD
jgi:glycosyl transferase family 25